ncbi:MAG: DegT/DnrJ/EryC1/StrS family aminotransferase [Clostridia bacterium]|nr:DegT/DnrJ/EryC1/StrS family aminotransferase [Clostridia bacterium]
MKKYNAQPPNFSYTFSDFFSVFKAMMHLQNNREKVYKDEREIFEEKTKKYFNIEYALSVTSCAVGIDLACESINLKEGDEVLSCAINFYGTHLSVLKCKAKLILVEPKENSVQIDPEDLMKKINIKTKAIIITQMNGACADMEKIIKYVKNKEKKFNKKIYIIEDIARAFGTEYYKKKVGTIGDIGILSFQTKKNFCTLGEGGMVVTKDKNIYNKIKELRAFGDRRVYGSNYKLSRVQCAVGLTQLKKFDKYNNKRIKIGQHRDKLLNEYKEYIYIEKYKNIKNIYTYYNIMLNEKFNREDRDKIREILLTKYNIDTCIANEPTYLTHEFINKNVDVNNTRRATNLGGRIISLSIHYNMKLRDNRFIVEALINSIKEVKK